MEHSPFARKTAPLFFAEYEGFISHFRRGYAMIRTGKKLFQADLIVPTEGGRGGITVNRAFFRTAVCVMLAAVLCAGIAGTAAGEKPVYSVNEWNFVDESLDVSQGLPKDTTGVLDRIRRTGVLRVATEPYYPPQEFEDPEKEGQEKYVGSDMELARLIARKMGVELEIIPMEFTDVLPALTEDRCDLTISAIAYTPERAGAYTLSKGYFFSGSKANSAIMIRAEDAEAITSVDDLSERNITAQRGSLQEAEAARHIQRYREFRRLPQVDDVYAAVQSGKADAGIVDMESAEIYIHDNPDAGLMLMAGVYFQQEEYERGDRICAKQGEYQLISFVNGVIDEVVQDGSYMKWFEEATKRNTELEQMGLK